MEFRALGTVAVFSEGEIVSLSGLERVVLGVLLLDAGRPVSAATIADALWGGAEPPSARKSLQMHISRLRQKLGAETIETTGPGYRLVARDVDVVRFAEHPVEELDTWRGRPYDDLGEWPPAVAAREALERLRADAEDTHAEARVQAGTATVAELEALVRRGPDREHRWVLLMRRLYRSGQQAAALRAFARARTVLREGYGVDPGPELVALERAILDHDPQLLATDDHLRRGRALRAHGQAAAALEAFERALELAEQAGADPRAAIDIAQELAQCARASGEPERATTVLAAAAERARLVEDGPRLAQVALASAGEGWITTLDPSASAITLLDEAAKALGEQLTPLRGRILARRAIAESHTRSLAAANEDATNALTLARVLQDPETIAAALLATLVVDQDLAHAEASHQKAVELLTLAAANDSWRWQSWALPHLARNAAVRGDMTRAFEHFDALQRIAETEDDPVARYAAAPAEMLRSTLALDLPGSLAAADRTRDAGIHALMDPTGAALAHFGTTGMLRLQHRRYGELRAPDLSFPQPTMQASYVASRALILGGSGALDDARAVLSTLAPTELAALPRDLYWPNLLWMHAELARMLDDHERAALTVELLTPFSDLHVLDGAGIYHGAIVHYLGVAHGAAGNLEAARNAFTAAVDAHHAAGAPAWAARSEQERAALNG